MTTTSSRPRGPFLKTEALRSIEGIEIQGVKIFAKELHDIQQSIGGNLVVDTNLNKALETGYNNYFVLHGEPPDAVANRAYPEIWFVPFEFSLTQVVSGASRPVLVPKVEKLLLFFAVSKKF